MMAHSIIHSGSISNNKQFGLSKEENAVIKAFDSKQIRELSENDISSLADRIWLITKTKLDLNPKSANDEKAKVMILMEDIRDYPNLTIDDVMNALKNGLNGKYLGKESFVHFNSSNFNIWMSKYQLEKNQIIQSINYKQDEDVEKNVYDQHKEIMMTIKATNEYIKEYKYSEDNQNSFNWYLSGLNYLYDDLVLVGALSFNTEQKKRIVEDVKSDRPSAQGEDLKKWCKIYGYIYFVKMMAKMNQYIDKNGKIQQISTY